MHNLDKDVIWLVVGILALGGAVYLCAIGRIDGAVVAALFGAAVKGLVDALSHKRNDDVDA